MDKSHINGRQRRGLSPWLHSGKDDGWNYNADFYCMDKKGKIIPRTDTKLKRVVICGPKGEMWKYLKKKL